MMKTKFFENVKVSLISGLVFLVLLELGLRAAGFTLLFIQRQKNKTDLNNKNIVKVMCIGESTTYMGGQDSYPSQLEGILNEANTGRTFKVINKGVPGVGSSYITSHLPEWIKQYRPDIVVSMTGINDYYNRVPVSGRGPIGRAASVIGNMRVVKLAKWLKDNLDAKLNTIFHKQDRAAENASKQKDQDSAGMEREGEQYRSFDTAPEKLKGMFLAGMMASQKGDYLQAERIFQVILNSSSGQLRNSILSHLGEIYMAQARYDKMVAILKERLSNPQDSWTGKMALRLCEDGLTSQLMTEMFDNLLKEGGDGNAALLSLIGACYTKQGNDREAESYFQKARDIRIANVDRVTRNNYLSMAKVLKDEGITTVLVQYPMRSIEELQNIFYETEFNHSILYVDNEKVFRAELEKGAYEEYFTDRFAGDWGHCTREGNRIIAGNVANAIIRHTTLQ